jgi:NADPH2:quinone reductase
MRAIGLHRYGGPDELVELDLPPPQPGPDDVLVRVAACSVNPADLRARAPAASRNIERGFPLVLGYDCAGVVETVGSRASGWRPGDIVMGSPSLLRPGANAEWVAVDGRSLALVPDELGLLEAAALPLAGVTALECLERGRAAAGGPVLVQGGAGGVGHLQIQLAKALGCRVIATAGRPESVALCRRLGADVVVDYRQHDVAEEVRRLTGGRGVPVVFDNVGGDTLAASIDAVAPMGTVVAIAPTPAAPTERLFMKAASLTYHLMGAAAFWGLDPGAQGAALGRLLHFVRNGQVRPHVSQVLPIRELAAAHRQLESGRTLGKVVLDVEGGW